MRQRLNTRQARAVPLILAVVIVDLMGMAYCHIKDVGMKFDERVYYMAYLFCGNIASSIALAAFALACYAFGSIAWLRRALAGAVVLSSPRSPASSGAARLVSRRWPTTSGSGTRSGSAP